MLCGGVTKIALTVILADHFSIIGLMQDQKRQSLLDPWQSLTLCLGLMAFLDIELKFLWNFHACYTILISETKSEPDFGLNYNRSAVIV